MGAPGFAIPNTTVGAAAPMEQFSWTAATVRARVRGFTIGNTAATAAQGVRFQLNRQSTDGTSSSITAAQLVMDVQGFSPTTVARSTYTVAATAGNVITDIGFDIVGTYILWYPPGIEPMIGTTGKLGLRKTVGADSSLWAATGFWNED
jgi:hypothetical protein